jgi:hypothetical protein
MTNPLSTALRVKYTHSSIDSGCLNAIGSTAERHPYIVGSQTPLESF